VRYEEKQIRSVGEMLELLKVQVKPKQLVWFRGQSDRRWKLVPSLARNNDHLKAEHALIKRFIQNATPHLRTQPQAEWEWMFLMQHHRAPTRLLDWTESPLAALFFATRNPDRDNVLGSLWCLDPIALNREANIKLGFESEIPAFGRDEVMANYLPSRLQTDKVELGPVAVIGPRNTPRMAAQLGTFTVNHQSHLPIEKIGDKKHVWRWKISSNAKQTIRRELSLLGYSPLTLFPELDRVADLCKELLE
jgi:hypothetical protein